MDNIYTEQIMAHYHNTTQAIYSPTQKDEVFISDHNLETSSKSLHAYI